MTITYIAHLDTGPVRRTLHLTPGSPHADVMRRQIARITNNGRRALPVRDAVFPVTIVRVEL